MSEDPYIVVHVNAEFSKLTGYSSFRVLGQSLHDLMGPEATLDKLKNCAERLVAGNIEEQELKLKTQSKKQKYISCNMSISPVGQPPKSATHLVLGLALCDGQKTPHATTSAMSPPPAPFRVLG